MRKALFALLWTGSLAFSQPADVPKGERCPVCGMDVNMDPKQTSQIKLKDGRYVFFAEIYHAMEYYHKNRARVQELWVKDAQSGKWIDGTKAFYVETQTHMGQGFLAFQSRMSAVSRAKGRKVYTFRDISPGLLQKHAH